MRDAERLAKLITIENGKALSDSRGEVAYAAEFFRWYAEEAVRAIGEVSRAPASGARMVVHHKPAGVAVLVTPWNFPAAMATRKIGPALAAGCTVVLKPASDTPLTMLALMPIMEEAGVPAGVINVIPSRSSGTVVSAMLHDEFAKKLTAKMAGLKVGNGLDEGVAVGPLVNAAARKKVIELVGDAVGRGAKVLTGGKSPQGPGHFYPPTVLDNVPDGASL